VPETPSLDERIAEAQRAMLAAETFVERGDATDALNALNAQKLAAAIDARNEADARHAAEMFGPPAATGQEAAR
jgi:hypothetical protein